MTPIGLSYIVKDETAQKRQGLESWKPSKSILSFTNGEPDSSFLLALIINGISNRSRNIEYTNTENVIHTT